MSTTENGAFSQYKVLLFDVYGTLIDWETGIYDALKPLFVNNSTSVPGPTKEAVLEAFSSVETDLQTRSPTMRYADLLARVHAELEARLQGNPSLPDAAPSSEAVIGTSAQPAAARDPHVAFGQSIASWTPFPDTIAALTTLSSFFKLVVLSNVDRASFSHTQRILEGDPAAPNFTFAAVYTAEDAGAYKPAPGALTYALTHLKEDFGVEKEEVLVTAQSLFHDVIPAKARGIDGAWIAREGGITGLQGTTGEEAKFKFKTLGEMAEAVKKDRAA